MTINFSISASGTNIVNQLDIDASLSKNLNIENFSDDQNNSANIDDYTFEWYFIDKPQNSSCSFDTTITSNDKVIRLDSIDTWGTYRVFCIAKETSNVANKSNDNPLSAEESSFINVIVKSSNNLLEKPASFQRDWKSQYDKLVDVVDNTTKRINNLKVSNSTTFSLPVADGTGGQVLTTNGSGLLSFSDLDLSNMENNISLNSLTDVNIGNTENGYTLVWNTDHWESGEVLTGNAITGLVSDDSGTLTISNGYNLVPADALATNDIGSFEFPLGTLFATSLDATTSLLLGDVLYTAIDGAANTYLKTNGEGTTSFSGITYSDISGAPSIETLIGGAPTSGQFLKWNDANNSWVPGDVSLVLSVSQQASSGSGTLDYVNDTGVFTYIPPDLSSFISLSDLSVSQNSSSGNGSLTYDNVSGTFAYTPPDLSNLGGGGGGLTNWTENSNGHLIPNSNESYDIGEAENKVRHLYLSDNSLFIGDASISLTTNDIISSDNSNKVFKLESSGIDFDSYKFSFSNTSPANISGGIVYRIKAIGTADFTLVGAKFNQVGHIFTSTTDGSTAGLLDDGISFVSQSENYDKVSLFVERDMMNVQNIKLKYEASGDSKEIIAITGSPMDIPGDPGIVTYNSGSWSSTTLSNLSIKKTITEKHSGEWPTVITYPDDPNNPGSKLNTFTSSAGPSKFLFAIKNNSGSSMSIKKITLTCHEMHSSSIDWTAATATDAEFSTNIATKLFTMPNQTINKTNESNGVGIGTVTFEDSNYNSLSNDYWLVIAINAITQDDPEPDPIISDKNFSISFSYT